MFKVLEDNVAHRANAIEVRYEFRAERLITNGRREVIGVWFRSKDGQSIAIKAKRGVVLACGGFEANEEMKRQYWEKAPVLTATSTANTGDGIRMAQDLAGLCAGWPAQAGEITPRLSLCTTVVENGYGSATSPLKSTLMIGAGPSCDPIGVSEVPIFGAKWISTDGPKTKPANMPS